MKNEIDEWINGYVHQRNVYFVYCLFFFSYIAADISLAWRKTIKKHDVGTNKSYGPLITHYPSTRVVTISNIALKRKTKNEISLFLFFYYYSLLFLEETNWETNKTNFVSANNKNYSPYVKVYFDLSKRKLNEWQKEKGKILKRKTKKKEGNGR